MTNKEAIKECKPPTDDWEEYADKLWHIAYKRGRNDVMKQVKEIIDNIYSPIEDKYTDICGLIKESENNEM